MWLSSSPNFTATASFALASIASLHKCSSHPELLHVYAVNWQQYNILIILAGAARSGEGEAIGLRTADDVKTTAGVACSTLHMGH
jgi:predicted Zn-dependent protease